MREGLSNLELVRRKDKWTAMVAKLEAAGELTEAAKWREAIDAAESILKRRERRGVAPLKREG